MPKNSIEAGGGAEETPEQAVESAKIKAAMAEVEARDVPEKSKKPTTITEKENSDLRKGTDYSLGISQDVGGNIKIEITSSRKGKEYSKTGLVPKEKIEEFNAIVKRLSYEIRNFGEAYGSPEAAAKKGVLKIEDLLVEVEHSSAASV